MFSPNYHNDYREYYNCDVRLINNKFLFKGGKKKKNKKMIDSQQFFLATN